MTENIHRYSFNTAVAALMEYVNELYKTGATKEDLIVLARLLKPFAPHLASEMLEKLDVDDEWPKWDEKYLVAETIEIIVQVNGKMRGKINVSLDSASNEDEVVKEALKDEKIAKYVEMGIKKQIFVPRARILNFVV